jgi:hypothetical protein
LVRAKPADAKITVSGPKSFDGGTSESRCPAGSYTVTVSSEGYLTQTRTFQIAAGEHHAETFELTVNPELLARKLTDSKSKLAAGDSAGALKLAGAVLQQDPRNADAALVVAGAAFQQGDMDRFVDAGTKAIRTSKPVTIAVMHVHMLWAPRIHRVDLTISESGVSLASDPPDERCKIPATVSFDQIADARVQHDPHGFIELRIQYASKPHGAILHDLDFVPEGSTIGGPAQTGQVFSTVGATIRTPDNSAQTLEGIVRLIARAKR